MDEQCNKNAKCPVPMKPLFTLAALTFILVALFFFYTMRKKQEVQAESPCALQPITTQFHISVLTTIKQA